MSNNFLYMYKSFQNVICTFPLLSGYRANPCGASLAELVDADVVPSRDPRLSASLPGSIYLQICSVDGAFDSSDDSASFHSEDWYCEDVGEDFEAETKTLTVKVKVDPNYVERASEKESSDGDACVAKIARSGDTSTTPTTERGVTPVNVFKDEQSNKNDAEFGGCNNEQTPTEADKTTVEQDTRKTPPQPRASVTQPQEGAESTPLNFDPDIRREITPVENQKESKKHSGGKKSRRKTHKETSSKQAHRDKKHERRRQPTGLDCDVVGPTNPRDDTAVNRSAMMIKPDRDPEGRCVDELPVSFDGPTTAAHKHFSKKHRSASVQSERDGSVSGNATGLTWRRTRSISLDRISRHAISAQDTVDRDHVLDCQKVCVESHPDTVVGNLSPELGHIGITCDNMDDCDGTSRLREAVPVRCTRSNEARLNRPVSTGWTHDAGVQHDTAVRERDTKHSRSKRRHIPVRSTPEEGVAACDADLVSARDTSTIVERKSDSPFDNYVEGAKQRSREDTYGPIGVNMSDNEIGFSEVPQISVDGSADSCVNRTNRKDSTSNSHATKDQMFPLSGFVKYCFHERRKSAHRKRVNAVVKSQVQDVLEDMERVRKDGDFHDVVAPMKHLSVLSLPTELEASYVESPFVRQLHLQALREWMTKKPLDSLLIGRGQPSSDVPRSLPSSSRTDDTVTGCSTDFTGDLFRLLTDGRCGSDDVQDLYSDPSSSTQETVHHVFRQVRHYMEFLAKKPLHAGNSAAAPSSHKTPSTIEHLRQSEETSAVDGHTQASASESCNYVDSATYSKRPRRQRKLKRRKDIAEEIECPRPVDAPTLVIPLESEQGAVHDDPRAPAKRHRSKRIDDSINSIVSEFCEGVDQMLDANCLLDAHAQRKSRKRTGKHLSKRSHFTKRLMKMMAVKDREKHDAVPGDASDIPLMDVADDGTAVGRTDPMLYSPTRPTENDDADLVLPGDSLSQSGGKRKEAKRKTKHTAHGKSKKRKMRTKSGEDTKLRVGRTRRNKDKQRLSEEFVPLNVDNSQTGKENTPRIKERQSSTDDKRSNLDSEKFAHEYESASAECSQPRRSGNVDKHADQMNRFRRQLRSRHGCFSDSYLSSSGDAFGRVPVPNFDSSFDQTCSPCKQYHNPYVLTGPLLQYFVEKHETLLTNHVTRFCPSPTRFTSANLEPENSFLWSLALNRIKPAIASPEKSFTATNDAMNDKHEDLEDEPEDQSVNDLSVTMLEYQCVSPSKKSGPVKQGNHLMQAFRQAVEAKKRAKTIRTTAATGKSVVAKINNEKRPPPKTPVTLFKPPIAFALMTKLREDAAKAEAASAKAATIPRNGGHKFCITLPEMTDVNIVVQCSFDNISRQLEHVVASDCGSLAVNGIVRPDSNVVQHGLTVQHLSSLSTMATQMYKSQRDSRGRVKPTNPVHQENQSNCNRFVPMTHVIVDTRTPPQLTSEIGETNVSLNKDATIVAVVSPERSSNPTKYTTVLSPERSPNPSQGNTVVSPERSSKPSRGATVVSPSRSSNPTNDTTIISYLDPTNDNSISTTVEHPVKDSNSFVPVVNKKSKYEAHQNEPAVALSFDHFEDQEQSDEFPDQQDASPNKQYMCRRQDVGLEDDTTSRAALMRLEKLARSTGSGLVNNIPLGEKITTDIPILDEETKTECDQQDSAIVTPCVAACDSEATQQTLEPPPANDDVSKVVVEPRVIEPTVVEPIVVEPTVVEPTVVEPTVVEPTVVEPFLPQVVEERPRTTVEQCVTNDYGSPQDCNINEVGGKLTPKRSKLLQAFRQVVAAKNKASPDKSPNVFAKQKVFHLAAMHHLSKKDLAAPAKKKSKLTIDIAMVANLVSSIPEVKREDGVDEQGLGEGPVGRVVTAGDHTDAGEGKRVKANEPDEEENGHRNVRNAMVVSQWPPPRQEPSLPSERLKLKTSVSHATRPPARVQHLGNIPLPSFVGQSPAVVQNTPSTAPHAELSSDAHKAPPLPSDSSTAPPLPPDSLIKPPLPPDASTGPPLPPVISIQPQLAPVPLPAPPPPPGGLIAPPLPPAGLIAPPPLPVTSAAFTPTTMPWMTGEPSEHAQRHLQAMSSFLNQRSADTAIPEQAGGGYTDSEYPPYDNTDPSQADAYAYWCQQYYPQAPVDPYAWDYGQWGAYWNQYQQQPPSTNDNAWTPHPGTQEWPPSTYSGQTGGRKRRFLLPNPDSQPAPQWCEATREPMMGPPPQPTMGPPPQPTMGPPPQPTMGPPPCPTMGPPPTTGPPPPPNPVLRVVDTETKQDVGKKPDVKVQGLMLGSDTRMYVLNRDRLVCKSIEVSERVSCYMAARHMFSQRFWHKIWPFPIFTQLPFSMFFGLVLFLSLSLCTLFLSLCTISVSVCHSPCRVVDIPL